MSRSQQPTDDPDWRFKIVCTGRGTHRERLLGDVFVYPRADGARVVHETFVHGERGRTYKTEARIELPIPQRIGPQAAILTDRRQWRYFCPSWNADRQWNNEGFFAAVDLIIENQVPTLDLRPPV